MIVCECAGFIQFIHMSSLSMWAFTWRGFWFLGLFFCLGSVASMEVVVDDLGQIQSTMEADVTGSPSPSLLAMETETKAELECPVSEQVALGTKCKCGASSCAAGKYCFAMEKGSAAKCQDTYRQDPRQLDVYGVTKQGPMDGKDRGHIAGRSLKFYKKSASSGLRFFYSDNFRVHSGAHSAASRWEILVDGKSCPSSRISQDLHVTPRENPHRVNAFGGYCKDVGQGDHTIVVTVGPTPGYGAGRHDAYTGYEHYGQPGASWHLEVQEIPDDYALYHQKSGSQKDGRDSGKVTGRHLTFKKLYQDSRIRLSYSDNLRAHSGIGATACRYTLKIDEQPCGSGTITGDIYVHKGDNPLRPRTMVGYCDDISAGDHTVDVFVETTPGYSNADCYAGWLDSHYLLEAEEIPKEYPMVKYVMKRTADGRDSGVLPHYTLAFTKAHAETRVRLIFTENLRALSHQHNCACVWELLVDGKHCPNAKIFGQVYVHRNWHAFQTDTNPHRFRTFGGFCENLAKGSHTATVNLKQQGPSCDCYTGWRNSPAGNGAHGMLEVHKLFKPCASFDKGSCKGAWCYWSEKESRCANNNACPGHDKIAVGSTCVCGEKEATKGQFCYKDKTVHEEAKPEPKSFSPRGAGTFGLLALVMLMLWLQDLEA